MLAPLCTSSRAPGPRVREGEGKAGRGTFPASRLPPPAPSSARWRPTTPAPLAGQGRYPAAGRGPGNSTAELAAVSREEAADASAASAVRLPVSSLFLPPTTAPRPRPRLPLQDGRPRAQSPHQRPGPPSASLAPRYRRIGAAVRGSGRDPAGKERRRRKKKSKGVREEEDPPPPPPPSSPLLDRAPRRPPCPPPRPVLLRRLRQSS